ncbi:hypothetical protein Gpo141_00005762 [Globisporangium polare]
MGLLPQLRPSASKAVSHRGPQFQDQPLKQRSANVNVSNQVASANPLSSEAQQLKAFILAMHPEKQFVRFSLRRMRHKTTPPVAIPESIAHARALSACVSGKKVPFTRAMHANARQKAQRHQLDSIDEYVRY